MRDARLVQVKFPGDFRSSETQSIHRQMPATDVPVKRRETIVYIAAIPKTLYANGNVGSRQRVSFRKRLRERRIFLVPAVENGRCQTTNIYKV